MKEDTAEESMDFFTQIAPKTGVKYRCHQRPAGQSSKNPHIMELAKIVGENNAAKSWELLGMLTMGLVTIYGPRVGELLLKGAALAHEEMFEILEGEHGN